MSGDSPVFQLTVPSRLEEMAAIQRLVSEASEAFGLNEELAHWIELTVSESAINAIEHGNGLDPTKDVFLQISLDGLTIEVIVEDQGTGFQLSDIPDPTDLENLLKPGGRGILIIRSFMDKVEVTTREGGGSRLRMIKKIVDGHPA
jgi:serine/threonine-protein kinase RsbW